MGMEDRAWYRAEMARRKRPLRHGGSRRVRRLTAMTAAAMAALLVLPIAVGSSCNLDRWQTLPATCWQKSWTTLLQRIRGAPVYGACGYYLNSNGHSVPRPCGDWRTNSGAPPHGATALCRDGTYSYSEHPHGDWTCSYHGSVVRYL